MKQLMRKLAIFVIFVIVTFVILPAGWSGEFNYVSYTKTTLQDIVAEEQHHHSLDQTAAKKQADYIQLECRVSKYRVRCSYSDVQRRISEEKKKIIKMWMETLQIDTKLASLYQHEIQVAEGENICWIPIQEQLSPFMNEELVKNDEIELFIILIGNVESEYVFIATEFEKAISPAKNSTQVTAGKL